MNSKELGNYFSSVGIPLKWHTKTLRDFDNDKEALSTIINYLDKAREAYKEGVGFYLHGKNGVGKTHLLMTSFMQLFDQRFTVRVISLTELVNLFTSSWYDEDKKEELVLVMSNVHFLGIEEMGKQLSSDKSLEIVTHVLETVLRSRVQNKKPTWFTSNISASSLKDIYNEDIASMLRECALPLLINGDDVRREISKSNKEKWL